MPRNYNIANDVEATPFIRGSRIEAKRVDLGAPNAIFTEEIISAEDFINKHTQAFKHLTESWVAMNTPLTQIQSAMALATDVFGDEKVAEEWLGEPNLATDEKPPLALLGTESGFERVRALLQRIEYGVLT